MMGKRKKNREQAADVDETTAGTTAGTTATGGTDGDEQVQEQLGELERVISEREQFRGQWERARADYQNLLHRLPRQVEDLTRAELEPLLRDLLQVLDYLDMAMASPTESADAKNLAFGVDMVRKQLIDTLGRYSVEPLPVAAGQHFDPAQHEAVAREASENEPDGTILSVAKRGFSWRGRVLRHAHVKVAGAAVEESAEDTPLGATDRAAPNGSAPTADEHTENDPVDTSDVSPD